ncbi:unnamed protein product [Heterobilharzia americana]|nr:unnamed protein product [Heterobilharzia americana]
MPSEQNSPELNEVKKIEASEENITCETSSVSLSPSSVLSSPLTTTPISTSTTPIVTSVISTTSLYSSAALFNSVGSLKRARVESTSVETNHNTINQPNLPTEFPCPCGQIISVNSSGFLEHARQCQEFMMTASNFAEVIAMNAAMVMSSEWNKCLPLLNHQDYFMMNNKNMSVSKNVQLFDGYKSPSSLTLKRHAHQDDHHERQRLQSSSTSVNTTVSYSHQSALDLSFRSNEMHPTPTNNDVHVRHDCPECPLTSTDVSVILRHFEAEHNRIGNFTCSKCNESYDYLPDYLKHQMLNDCLSNPLTLSPISHSVVSSFDSTPSKKAIAKTVTSDACAERDCSYPMRNYPHENYNHLMKEMFRCRNYSSASSPPTSPRTQSINDYTTVNTTEIHPSKNIAGSDTTTTTTTNVTVVSSTANADLSNTQRNNGLENFALVTSLNATQTTPSKEKKNKNNNTDNDKISMRGSPLLNGLMNSLPYDSLKLSRGSLFSPYTHDNSSFSPTRILYNENKVDGSSFTTTLNNIDDNSYRNDMYPTSPSSSRPTNPQSLYSNFMSNLQSIGKSYLGGTMKCSKTLGKEIFTNSPINAIMMNNGVGYNNVTSVNSLLMNEFSINQRQSGHSSHHRGHMKDHLQHHHHEQRSHQSNTMNNLSSAITPDGTTDLSRPFKCCHCIKAFKSKALLDQHMHIHYPPKYTCRYCAKKYRWPPVFYHHQRTCKKRPPSTTCTNNDTHTSTVTVTMASSSNTMKHNNHSNLSYLTSGLGKNCSLTSEPTFIKPSGFRSENHQADERQHNTISLSRSTDDNKAGNGAFQSYGHTPCFTPFNSDLHMTSGLLELSNNPAMIHNSNNNGNIINNISNDDLSLMSPSNFNNFATLAAAAAAAAMSMHFQIPSISHIPPPPPPH